MLISHDYRFIFIKTRKTAGTSLEGLLQRFCAPEDLVPVQDQAFLETRHGIVAGRSGGQQPADPLWAHSSAERIRSYVGDDRFDAYTKILPVRNPFDKTVSWFWWLAWLIPEDRLREDLAGDFDKARWFFRNWLLMRPTLPADRQFYNTSAGPVDAHLIHFESIADDLQAIAGKLGLDIRWDEMPAWKSEPRMHRSVALSSYFDDETAQVVRETFRIDFRRFGYSTEVPDGPAGTEPERSLQAT